jgi:glutamate--cysteine ligase
MPSPTPTLTTEAARDLIREAAFPETTGNRVGIEIEWFTTPSRSPASVSTLRRILEPQLPLRRGSTITFEPGGQVELSSRPMDSCGTACNALARDLGTVRRVLKDRGIGLVASGIDPDRPLRLVTDEQRYVSMKAYFDEANHAGAHMMCTTSAVHVNLDAGRDAEGRRRWKLAHQLGPMLVAAFANSPMVQGRPSGWLSARMGAWLAIDHTRAAPALNGADPRDAWASYALRANVMFLRTPRRFQPLSEPLPFEAWIERGHELGHPTADDLTYHLTTLFPPVRPRGWLELRMIDMVPDPWWRAAAAVTTALMCDEQASSVADGATRRTADMWFEAARFGLRHPPLREASKRCFEAALDALDRDGRDPRTRAAAAGYYEHYIARGRCPADDQLESRLSHNPSNGHDGSKRIPIMEAT